MRRTVLIPITHEGRDKGKTFKMTEMAASQGERWAIRAFLVLAAAGIEIPDDTVSMGLAGLAQVGMSAFARVNYEDAEPILDDMLKTVKIVPDQHHPEVLRDLIETDIEEISTRLHLRKEFLKLHLGFFTGADR